MLNYSLQIRSFVKIQNMLRFPWKMLHFKGKSVNFWAISSMGQKEPPIDFDIIYAEKSMESFKKQSTLDKEQDTMLKIAWRCRRLWRLSWRLSQISSNLDLWMSKIWFLKFISYFYVKILMKSLIFRLFQGGAFCPGWSVLPRFTVFEMDQSRRS